MLSESSDAEKARIYINCLNSHHDDLLRGIKLAYDDHIRPDRLTEPHGILLFVQVLSRYAHLRSVTPNRLSVENNEIVCLNQRYREGIRYADG
jgi:hypothetical protein